MPVPLISERPFKSLRRSLDKGSASGRLLGARSYFSKIPVEIIGLIFEHATHSDKDIKRTEVILSHVCRHWRAVALNTATLWTSMAIDMSKHISPATFLITGTRILTYLARSKFLLIDVWLNIAGTQLSYHRIHLMDALVNHVARWRRLTVLTNSESQTFLVSRMLGDRYTPNLESVTVRLDSPVTNNDPISLDPLVFRNGAPMLSYLSLDVSSSRIYLPPLQNVTTLLLSAAVYQPPCFTFKTFCTLLCLPLLEALSLHQDICGSPLDSDVLGNLSLPNLRHLRLDASPVITNLLMYFNAPNLESLVIKDVDLGSSGDIGEPTYPKDPSTCFPSLKYLTLSGADPTSPSSAIPIARITRSIEHLVVSDYTFCIIYDIDWTDEKAGIWPNLCSLTVCCGCSAGYGSGSGGFAEPSYFLSGAQIRRGMTYRFMPETLGGMRDNNLEGLNELMAICSIEEITSVFGFTDAEWPPPRKIQR